MPLLRKDVPRSARFPVETERVLTSTDLPQSSKLLVVVLGNFEPSHGASDVFSVVAVERDLCLSGTATQEEGEVRQTALLSEGERESVRTSCAQIAESESDDTDDDKARG
jgi:hypothetical protein